MRRLHATKLSSLALLAAFLAGPAASTGPSSGGLDAKQISAASAADATTADDGVVRISWARTDVPLRVDRMELSPAAGVTSWAAFAGTDRQAMMMGDTVVFEDEVDAAMDAAFAHGLSVTGLHDHFAYDEPKVSFMHIGGTGTSRDLAAAVRAVWDAIRQVRAAHPEVAMDFGGPAPTAGTLDAGTIAKIVGQPAPLAHGVAKVTVGRKGVMHGMPVAASMGLTTWAAFTGSDAAAAIDGDVIMTAAEVQPVLQALRKGGLHVVALHNHMIGETPPYYFTHFWGTGRADALAKAFREALDRTQP